MIYDLIEHSDLYKGITPQLSTALELLKNTDFSALAPGRYELDDAVYYNIMDCDLLPFSETKWECHRKYIDIQYLLEEGEQIGVLPTNQLTGWGEYSQERDICFAGGDAAGVVLPMRRHMFALFFPGDAHRPGWTECEPKSVRKVVIKIPVSLSPFLAAEKD